MTYDQLEMLEAIVEKGSYKLAAESLHKSQPSLSMGIKKLEEEFDLVLFNRDQYRASLTAQGKVFYQWSRECLESFRTLSVIGSEMGQQQIEPLIKVVLDPLVEYDDIHAIFENCLGPHNPTQLSLRSEILGKGMELVLEKEADFCIGMKIRNEDKIEARFFKSVEMIPVAHKKIAKDYKKFPQIIVTSPDSQGEITSGSRCFVSDHALKCRLIQSGYGWGRLARHEIEKELKAKTLLKLNDPVVKPLTVDLHLIRHKFMPLGPVAKKIWMSLS